MSCRITIKGDERLEIEQPRGRIIIPECATRIDIGKLGGELLPLAEGITEIDLADCRGITDIYLSSLGIKDIDLTKCCKLKTLSLNDMCITDIDLSSCKELVILELTSTRIENIDLLCCKNLTRVCFRYSEYLTKVDLTACKNLKIIQLGDFTGCKEASVKLPASITGIMEGAFGENDDSYCKKVLVPNEEMKQLVIASGYPEDRIEMY